MIPMPSSARSARKSPARCSTPGIKSERIAAIGLTNQRETTIVWERATGRAIAPALVWQDRRTAETCERLKSHQAEVARQTGLVIDPYFSATKIAWILDHVPHARERAQAGELAAGTVDTFVIWHLTGGSQFVTDATNASRTLLMDLHTIRWSPGLCELFGVPPQILAEIRPSAGDFGVTKGLDYLPDGLPIRGVAGDQQASLVGQGCLSAGQAKCTYGTGAFLLAHTGDRIVPSRRGLITTLAATLEDGPPQYALEGSVFVAGAAVQWFRDGLKAIGASHEISPLALASGPENELIFVPALTGPGGALLGARRARRDLRADAGDIGRRPRPRDPRRGRVPGRRPDRRHERRPGCPADRYPCRRRDGAVRPVPPVPGGSAQSADPPQPADRVDGARGAALLAGLGSAFWPDPSQVIELLQSGGQTFMPARDDQWRKQALGRWRHAVDTVIKHHSNR